MTSAYADLTVFETEDPTQDSAADDTLRCPSSPPTEAAQPTASAAARLLEIATRNADELMAEAEAEAERVTTAAREEADLLRSEAQREAEQARVELEESRTKGNDEIARFRARPSRRAATGCASTSTRCSPGSTRPASTGRFRTIHVRDRGYGDGVPETSPTSRALSALEAIQASPGINAERLGARLGVSERAARRYVAILREAEIPIESERGPYGGYRVGRGLRLPPLCSPPLRRWAW